jgi:acetylornithine deacetylase/succinyl-diaminopimelate desuccinylase-like protein
MKIQSCVNGLVDALDLDRFVQNIQVLSEFGDRRTGSTSYDNGESWIAEQLSAAGYQVERHMFMDDGQDKANLYVSRVGRVHPDGMYLVSAHLDDRGGRRSRRR